MRKALTFVLLAVLAIATLPAPAGAYTPDYPGCESWIGKPTGETLDCDRWVGQFQNANTIGGHDTIRTSGSDASDDVLFGGDGRDVIYAYAGDDDLFGGDFCRETGYYTFENRAAAEGWPDVSTLECNVGSGSDEIHAAAGDDWLWESNSDNYGDGKVDYLYCGAGNDYAVAEAIDWTDGKCETLRIVPTNPDLP